MLKLGSLVGFASQRMSLLARYVCATSADFPCCPLNEIYSLLD